MAELLEFLIIFLLELFGDVLIQLGLEWPFNRIPAAIRRSLSNESHSVLQATTWFLVGGGMGAVSVLIYDHPFFRRGRVPGLSLLLSPLLTGAVMELFGRRRAVSGKERLPLSNFRNGAAFAFGFALIRFLFAAAS